MKRALLPLLACPACSAALRLETTDRDGDEIVAGALACDPCGRAFPVRHGVPRFAGASAETATARNFGAEWAMFDEIAARDERQLRDWIAPVTPDFVRASAVLEAGCGKGRHTRLLAEWGAAPVVAVDASAAADVAYRHTRHLPNAHVIQADLYRLPLRPVFDYALSVGVLHHLADPRAGFDAIVGKLRPGGAVSVWVYGRENNGWIIRTIDPIRRGITSRVPPRLLYWLTLPIALLVFLASRVVARFPPNGAIGRLLPYREYLTYVSRFPLREIHCIVFDHLHAPIAWYLPRPEFDAWFRRPGAASVTIGWHNRNSWRGFAVIGSSEG